MVAVKNTNPKLLGSGSIERRNCRSQQFADETSKALPLTTVDS